MQILECKLLWLLFYLEYLKVFKIYFYLFLTIFNKENNLLSIDKYYIIFIFKDMLICEEFIKIYQKKKTGTSLFIWFYLMYF